MATIPDNKEWIESITAISKTDPVRFDVLNKTVEQINSRLGWLRENTEPSFSEVMIVNDHDGHLAIESLPEGVFSVVLGEIEINLSGGDSIAAGTEYHFCNAVNSRVSFADAEIISKGGTELVGDWHVCTLKKLEGNEWALFGDLAPDEPALEGFVIKTTGGVVSVIEGLGEVSGTYVYVHADGIIEGDTHLEEVLSWPEEKPAWFEGDGIFFPLCVHLIKVPDTLPAWITDMSDMFYGCSSFNGDLSGWDTSSVTNMNYMFAQCSIFNQDISGWDTSNVTDMSFMFYECSSFNGDLSGWDTSNVTDMNTMFYKCSNFNQGLSGWDVSSVTGMRSMFRNCASFNQDISRWDVSSVANMDYMFYECSSFNQDLSGWCVSSFSEEPFNFSYNTTSWTLPKPIWGTCPQQGLAQGEEFEGGYFVGVSFDGDYNLFVSKGEIGSYKFSESDYAPYTSADSETDGYYNTQQILNTSSSYAFPATQACDEHFSDGFGGWFLPSRYELGLLRDNSSHVPLVLPARVWTSEDRMGERSLTFYFNAGNTGTTYKSNTFPVYAFRRVLR